MESAPAGGWKPNFSYNELIREADEERMAALSRVSFNDMISQQPVSSKASVSILESSKAQASAPQPSTSSYHRLTEGEARKAQEPLAHISFNDMIASAAASRASSRAASAPVLSRVEMKVGEAKHDAASLAKSDISKSEASHEASQTPFRINIRGGMASICLCWCLCLVSYCCMKGASSPSTFRLM
jgi:hypothetical protein